MAVDTALERASTFITIDADGEVTNGETIVVAGKTYTFNSTLGSSDGDVHVGADAAGHRANLIAAINLSDEGESSTGAGNDYAAAMTRNPHVHAVESGSTVVVYSIIPGAIGNLIPVTAGTSGVTVDNATLENGSGHLGDFFDGLFELNQINAEVATALRAFSTVEGGALEDIGTA